MMGHNVYRYIQATYPALRPLLHRQGAAAAAYRVPTSTTDTIRMGGLPAKISPSLLAADQGRLAVSPLTLPWCIQVESPPLFVKLTLSPSLKSHPIVLSSKSLPPFQVAGPNIQPDAPLHRGRRGMYRYSRELAWCTE